MSYRKGNMVVLEIEPDDECELCGKVDELRPYGPNGERICYECGMKNKETTKIMLNHKLFGIPLPDGRGLIQ